VDYLYYQCCECYSRAPSFRIFEVIILKHRDAHHFRVARLFSPAAPEAASQKPRPGSPAGCCGLVHFYCIYLPPLMTLMLGAPPFRDNSFTMTRPLQPRTLEAHGTPHRWQVAFDASI
jgi:hypothetical protein